MPDNRSAYPTNSWGPLAADPFGDPATGDRAFRAAAWGAWWRNGGTKEAFLKLCPECADVVDGP